MSGQTAVGTTTVTDLIDDMPTDTKPKPFCKPGSMYVAHDRFVCDNPSCAGATALFTGRTIGGAKLVRVTIADVAEWETYDIGAMHCECGAMTLTAEPDPKGWPVPAPAGADTNGGA